MDLTTSAALLILFVGSLLLLLCLMAGVLQAAERRFPAFSRFLDRHVGEEPKWRQW